MGFQHKTFTILLLVSAVAACASPAPLLPAWRNTSRGLFREAHVLFAPVHGREARLGEAATLLQLQPKTEANIQSAIVLLTEIIDAVPDDEVGLTALYLLGRIEHIHRATPDLSAAALHYHRLLDSQPGHPLAGQAAAKLAIIELYKLRPADERPRLIATFSALAGRLPDVSARRDLHLILGEAALRFELDPALALDQFVAALDAGIIFPMLRADTLVRVGELARTQGRTELARQSYRTFLAEFPRDTRRLLIAEALTALPSGGSS